MRISKFVLHFACVLACLTAMPGATEQLGDVFRHQAGPSSARGLSLGGWYRRLDAPLFPRGGMFFDPETFQNSDSITFEMGYGAYSLFYEPYLEAPSAQEMLSLGENMVWGHRVGFDWRFRNGVRFSIRERMYFYGQTTTAAFWQEDLYANPFFENRLTARLEIPLGSTGLMARLPIHMKQVVYHAAEGATYSGQLRNWIWLSPELSVPVGTDGELAVSYATETLVSSRSGKWDVLGGLVDGALELTYRLQL